MQRYFVYIKYDGTAYHGWQVQPNANSVQAELQKALSTVLRQEIAVTGAGRTDTGVHARMMVAHFDTDMDIDCKQLVYRLNRILPRDISADRMLPVSSDMHARFSALSRTYHYYIHTHKDPFMRAYSCQMHYDLDYGLMNKAAALLLRNSDFASFCKSNSDAKTTICKVTEARWIKDGEYQWHFVITADRFLRNMVRAVVGTLVEVGRGRLSLHDFQQVVEGHNRSAAGESMPVNALFLENIEYKIF